jgi:hypothetical protein
LIIDENNQNITLRTHPKLSQIFTSVNQNNLKIQFGHYKEEKIKSINLGDVILSNPKMCPRCVIVTLDENTGESVSQETFKYLPLHKSE